MQQEGPCRGKGRGGLETPRAVHLENRVVMMVVFWWLLFLFSRCFDCGCIKRVIRSPILSPRQSRWGERLEVEPGHNFDHSFIVSVFHQLYWWGVVSDWENFIHFTLASCLKRWGSLEKSRWEFGWILYWRLSWIRKGSLHQILEKKYELWICCRHLWDYIKHQKEETMQPIKVVKFCLFQSITVQKIWIAKLVQFWYIEASDFFG